MPELRDTPTHLLVAGLQRIADNGIEDNARLESTG